MNGLICRTYKWNRFVRIAWILFILLVFGAQCVYADHVLVVGKNTNYYKGRPFYNVLFRNLTEEDLKNIEYAQQLLGDNKLFIPESHEDQLNYNDQIEDRYHLLSPGLSEYYEYRRMHVDLQCFHEEQVNFNEYNALNVGSIIRINTKNPDNNAKQANKYPVQNINSYNNIGTIAFFIIAIGLGIASIGTKEE